MRIFLRDIFLSVFKIGYIKIAPGTFASIFATLIATPILYFSESVLFMLSILLAVIATKQIDIYEKNSNKHDEKHIVIDELIGVWVALSMSGFGTLNMILSLIFFRIYDIWKPSIIGRIDKKVKGGLGVVADDIIAGIVGGISSLLTIVLLQKLGLSIKI